MTNNIELKSNKKKVWLINHDAMPPHLESRFRTIKIAQYIGNMGYDVTIIASSVMHNMGINLIENNSLYIEKEFDNLKFIFINTTLYKKNGLLRVIGLLEFPIKLHFLRKKFPKPDFILHTANIPFDISLYYTSKKLKAKYVLEILDLWPESFVDLGILSKKNPLIKIAYYYEKWLYSKCDNLVFSMEGGKDYLKYKKWDIENGGPVDLKKVHYINNGVDLNDFNLFKTKYILQDIDLLNDNLKKIIYIGSIRLANNLVELINAADCLKNSNSIVFLIYGDGDQREKLIQMCKDRNIHNVLFKDKWVDPKFVPFILTKSTVNILNYKSGEFGKYGGSQSKLFQYLASGNPICSNLQTMYCLINKFNLGVAKEFNTSEEYANSILSLVNQDEVSRAQMKQRALKIVSDFDYSYLSKKIATVFQS